MLNNDKVLTQAKALYDLGFAIHWLRPRAKNPVKSLWSGPVRDNWETLQREYISDFNIGIRLGAASTIEGYCLAAIDLDIKSENPKHKIEAESWIDNKFPGLRQNTAHDFSGRGNGSAHFLVRVKAPIESGKLVASNEETTVQMPSTKPTKRQIEILGQEKIDAGLRLRPAWEVSFMCMGCQIAIPPSIHPDTKREYYWGKEPKNIDDVMIINSDLVANSKRKAGKPFFSTIAKDFQLAPKEIDLKNSTLPKDIIDMIINGTNVTDRSASLFIACIEMVREKFTDEEILTVLTDRSYYLGQTGYDHAKTDLRSRAAKWVHDYSLTKARRETDAKHAFDSEIVVNDTLDKKAAKKQAIELGILDGSRGVNDLTVIKNIISENGALDDQKGLPIFMRNMFSVKNIYGCDTVWGGKKGKSIDADDIVLILDWLSANFKKNPKEATVYNCIAAIALDNKFHPIKDYLESLKWDGVSRIDSAFKYYLQAEAPEPYLSSISRIFFIAMVKRIYEPGCKYDYMPIFESAVQGLKKSMFGTILATPDYFYDELKDLKDKDSVLGLQGIWLLEMGELKGLNNHEVNDMKAFITRQIDKMRPPFERCIREFPRQCVLFGTTNNAEFLKDSTGNRRFWPIEVGKCKEKDLSRDRDQLFAEAKHLYDTNGVNELLYLVGEAETQALIEQKNKVIEGVQSFMDEEFKRFLKDIEDKDHPEFIDAHSLKLYGLFEGFGPFKKYPADQMHLNLAKAVLLDNGYKKKLIHGRSFWKKPPMRRI